MSNGPREEGSRKAKMPKRSQRESRALLAWPARRIEEHPAHQALMSTPCVPPTSTRKPITVWRDIAPLFG